MEDFRIRVPAYVWLTENNAGFTGATGPTGFTGAAGTGTGPSGPTGSSFYSDTWYVSNILPNGTNGGTAVTGIGSNIRAVNTLAGSASTDVQLPGSNRIQFATGVYDLEGYSITFDVNYNRLYLNNVTDGNIVETSILGLNVRDENGACTPILGQLTVSGGPKSYEFKQFIETGVANVGLGNPSGTGAPLLSEVYFSIRIQKRS